MNPNTKEEIKSLGLWAGFVAWFFSAPDDKKQTFVDKTVNVVSRFCMLLLVIVVSITFYEIVMRYVFVSPTIWVNEMTLWLGSVIFLVSGMYAMQRRSHIRITAVYDILPPKWKVFCELFAVLVLVAYAALFIIPSFPFVVDVVLAWETLGTIFNPPVPATIKPLCLIVTFLITVQAINNFIIDYKEILANEQAAKLANERID